MAGSIAHLLAAAPAGIPRGRVGGPEPRCSLGVAVLLRWRFCANVARMKAASRACWAPALVALMLATTTTRAAAERRDDAVFGGEVSEPSLRPPVAQPTPAEAAGTPPPQDPPRASGALGAQPSAFDSDRLQLGGLLLLRFGASLSDGGPEDQRLSMPNLLDLYLDARPNDRLRAFARGRLLYEPTIDETSALARATGQRPVRAQLNELWLKLDLARRLFLTLGQQRLLWGATRIWNPVDFINREYRPVLSPFDARNGVPLVKLHLPLEALGWNLYAAGVLERATRLDGAGLLVRGEVVLGTVEAALTGAYRRGSDPRLGLDLSAGIWDLDLSGECALRFPQTAGAQPVVQSAAGVQYSLPLFDRDLLLLGGEYFFNAEGARRTDPLELVSGRRQFFYAGRHYAALFASLPRPGALDAWAFTLSAISNLSDRSALVRLDVSVVVLTHLTLQAFAVGHLGRHGELRFGEAAIASAQRGAARALLQPDDLDEPIPTQLAELGLWLRLDL